MDADGIIELSGIFRNCLTGNDKRKGILTILVFSEFWGNPKNLFLLVKREPAPLSPHSSPFHSDCEAPLLSSPSADGERERGSIDDGGGLGEAWV